MVGTAVQGSGRALLHAEAELGGNDRTMANGSEGLAHPFFTDMRAIDLGRVEKGHALVKGRADQGNHGLLVINAAVIAHHGQAAQADGGDFQRAQPAARHGHIPCHSHGIPRTAFPHARQQDGHAESESSGHELTPFPRYNCPTHLRVPPSGQFYFSAAAVCLSHSATGTASSKTRSSIISLVA